MKLALSLMILGGALLAAEDAKPPQLFLPLAPGSVKVRVFDTDEYRLLICGAEVQKQRPGADGLIEFQLGAATAGLASQNLRPRQTFRVESLKNPKEVFLEEIFPDPFVGSGNVGLGAVLPPQIAAPVTASTTEIKASVHTSGTYTLEVCGSPVMSVSAAPSDDGTITFDLARQSVQPGLRSGLPLNRIVRVIRDGDELSFDQVVSAAAASAIVTINLVKEGQTTITGSVTGKATGVSIEVLEGDGETAIRDSAKVESGSFTSGLTTPVSAGQTVLVTAINGSARVGSSKRLVETYGWGRVRFYLSAGATIATQDSKVDKTVQYVEKLPAGGFTTVGSPVQSTQYKREFNSADAFVALNVDYNWLSTLHDREPLTCGRPQTLQAQVYNLLKLIPTIRKYGKHMDKPASFEVLKQGVLALGAEFEKADKPCNNNNTNVAGNTVLSELRYAARLIALPEFQMAMGAKPGSSQQKNFHKKVDEINGMKAEGNTDKKADAITAEWKHSDPEESLSPDFVFERLKFVLKMALRNDPSWRDHAVLLNSSLEGRLTQVPTTAEATKIIQNPRSASLEIATYVAFIRKPMRWEYKGREHALFFAPLLKLRGEPFIHPERDASDSRSLFSHSYGARLGHFGLDPRRHTIAPELHSYLDVTMGQWDNFTQPTNHRPWRIETHGRFKIPGTIAYIGFTNNFGPGPDDFRVFFGTRFDLAKALTAAFKSDASK